MSDDPDLFRFDCGHEIPMALYIASKDKPFCTVCRAAKAKRAKSTTKTDRQGKPK